MGTFGKIASRKAKSLNYSWLKYKIRIYSDSKTEIWRTKHCGLYPIKPEHIKFTHKKLNTYRTTKYKAL